jgi:hypothetical protein
MKYFIRKDKHGDVEGPFAGQELLAKIQNGSLAMNSLASSDLGGGASGLRVYRHCDWFPLPDIPELRSLFAPPADWIEASPRTVELARTKPPVKLEEETRWRPFQWLFDGSRVKLTTPLSPEEFARRFRQLVDGREFTLFVSSMGSTRFRGTLSSSTFRTGATLVDDGAAPVHILLRPMAAGRGWGRN